MRHDPLAYAREYHKTHKVQRRTKAQEWYSSTGRANHLKRKYGISTEDYDALLVKQEGVCAICRVEKNERLAVDHDHSTGRVRGLLCLSCNRTFIGNRTLELFERAVAYLKE